MRKMEGVDLTCVPRTSRVHAVRPSYQRLPPRSSHPREGDSID